MQLMDNVLWRAAPPDQFVRCDWDGNYIVYHRPSGLTHVLNSAMFHLLNNVLREPVGLSAAMDRLSRIGGDEASCVTPGQMIDLILRLEHLGLVRRE